MTPLEDPSPAMPIPGSWRDPHSDKPLSAEACQRFLNELPSWRLGPSHAEIVRRFRFASRLSAVFYMGIVLDFARHLAVEPEVQVRGTEVTVRIGRPGERGLTRRDFQLARRVSLFEDLTGSPRNPHEETEESQS